MSQVPLDYRPPEPPLRRPIVSWPMLWQCLRVGAFLSIIMGVVLPAAQRTYANLNFKLPPSTQFLLVIRNATWNALFGYGWVVIWMALLAIPFLWPLLIPPRPKPPGKKRRSLGWLLVSVLFMLIAAAITIAAVLPMFTLVDAYQNSTAGSK